MTKRVDTVVIDGESLTLQLAEQLAAGAHIELAEMVKPRVDANREVVEVLIASDQAIYGLNTGFGYYAGTRIASDKLKKLQLNILRSHAAGYGAPLDESTARLCAALRLNVLARGYTGVRYAVLEQLKNVLNAGISPLIPEYGSVGASGDLAPLAHVGLCLLGEGDVWYKGQRRSAADALHCAQLQPLVLAEKEGLSLINGTQVILALGSVTLAQNHRVLKLANQVSALTCEALAAHVAPFDERIHSLRGQAGQVTVAKDLREHLSGSYLFTKNVERSRVQDPYSLRCVPQVHGASLDTLCYTATILGRELNAVTDNPLVFTATGDTVSGGNFHAQPLALALDMAALAVAELGNISERRLELLLNPHHSQLHAFLAVEEGLQSGYMAAQYLSASLVNENKLLANPACTDSIPGNVGIEDHVSMGMTSARKLKKLTENCEVILAIEALVAVQAIDMRTAGPLGHGSAALYELIRGVVPFLAEDRVLSVDIDKAVKVVRLFIKQMATKDYFF